MSNYEGKTYRSWYGWLKKIEGYKVEVFENTIAYYNNTREGVFIVGDLYVKTTTAANDVDYLYLSLNDNDREFIRLYDSKKNFRVMTPKQYQEKYPEYCL